MEFNHNILQVSQWIKSRRSLYPLQMEPYASIPKESIKLLLEHANYAPSHKRTEPWRYQVFAGDAKLKLIDKMLEIFKALNPELEDNHARVKKLENRKTQVSHLIAICMHRDPKEQIPEFEEEYSVACSVQNMLLSMKALNMVGYWSTGKLAFSAEMKEYLNLEGKDKCLGFLLLGVPKEGLPDMPKEQMSPIETKVIWR